MRRRLGSLYHVAVYREDFEPRRSYSFHPWKLLVVMLFVAGLIVLGTAALIAYTSLREYIPGYPAIETRRRVLELMRTTDSLQDVINKQVAYLDAMQRSLFDHSPFEEEDAREDTDSFAPMDVKPEALAPTEVEVEFRQSYESSFLQSFRAKSGGERYFPFLPPVMKGYKSSDFDPAIRHFAIDIATPDRALFRAIAPGRVVFRGLTPAFGHVVVIQHQGGFVSIFKHCAAVFPKVGNFVHAGMPIGRVGSTGELSTGPHLHFELWLNGVPLDPSHFIKLSPDVWEKER